MPSLESDELRIVLQSIADRIAQNPGMELETLRAVFDVLGSLAAEPTGVSYEEADADGLRALWCNPIGASMEQVVLYLHGGGFICCGIDSHRKLAAHLAKATGVRSLMIDYRRAPEHTFPAQLDDALHAHGWLIDQGYNPGGIAVAGDSAGANLATTMVLKMRDGGLPLPAAIVALSPWYDMEADGPTMDSNAATEALLHRPIIESIAATFLGDRGSRQDPLANPLYADATGLPPIYLAAGGSETLLDNAERFADIAKDSNVEVALEVGEGMQHCWQYMAGRAPEADQSIARIGTWLREKLRARLRAQVAGAS